MRFAAIELLLWLLLLRCLKDFRPWWLSPNQPPSSRMRLGLTAAISRLSDGNQPAYRW